MILIADSGSTKTDWILFDHANHILHEFSSIGLNPNILSDENIKSALNNEVYLMEIKDSISDVFFYGAGCAGKINIDRLTALFKTFFSNSRISVKSDMEAAVNATCNSKPAVVAILGTGSNACYFDGESIAEKSINLGYILGDEGSGCYFGKILLRDYFYGQLPKHLEEKFNSHYALKRDEVIKNIYSAKTPNQYIASFFPFFIDNKEEEYCQSILRIGFQKFIRIYLQCFEKFHISEVHFVGSVSFYFQELLRMLCAENKIVSGKFLQSPVHELVKFHKLDVS